MGFDNEASSSSYTLPTTTEDSPLIPKSLPRSSQLKTFANVFIAIVGAGVLGLPYTFKKTSWIFGVFMIFTVSILTYHCMMLLVYTRRKIESDQSFSKIKSFGDLGFTVCGPIRRFTVDTMIVLSQAGFCVSYLIFIANTLAHVINSSATVASRKLYLSGGTILGLKLKTFYIWGCFPFQLGLNSIPTLTHLAPLSIFADVVDLGAMGVVMVEYVLIFMKQMPVLDRLWM